jgi:hypothetical protein
MKMGVFLKSLPFHSSLTTKGFTTQDIKAIDTIGINNNRIKYAILKPSIYTPLIVVHVFAS